MTEIYLALGSNVGDRKINLRRGIKLLSKKVHVEAKSKVYETKPMYLTDQPKFLNMVIRGRTDLSPQELLSFVKDVESLMGAHTHNQPRIIDIDILFYGLEHIHEPDLEIPHPRIRERAFVLLPLSHIASQFKHPHLGATIAELLAKLSISEGDIEATNIRV